MKGLGKGVKSFKDGMNGTEEDAKTRKTKKKSNCKTAWEIQTKKK